MSRKTGSFFAQLRQKLFDKRVNHEIFDRIFPHHLGEKDHGFSFDSRQEMIEQTEKLDVRSLLDSIERQIEKMPKAYGESFRHIMHRDLHERLKMFEQVARRRVKPDWCDPRFVATHA